MKKIISFLIVLTLLAALTLTVAAEKNDPPVQDALPTESGDGGFSELVDQEDALPSDGGTAVIPAGYTGAYIEDGILYAYLFDDTDSLPKMTIDGGDFSEAKPVKLTDAGDEMTMTYYILIDPVVLKEDYASVLIFFQSLIGAENSRFYSAISCEDPVFRELGGEELLSWIDQEQKNGASEETDLLTAVMGAVEEIGARDHEEQGPVSLIVMADSEFSFTDEAKMVLHVSPEVMTSFVRFGAEEERERIWSQYENSAHLYFELNIPDVNDAFDGAAAIIENTGSLYCVKLGYTPTEERSSIRLSAPSDSSVAASVMLENVRAYGFVPVVADQTQTQDTTETVSEPATADQTAGGGIDKWLIVGIIGGVVLLLAVIVLIALLSRRKPRAPKGVPMLTVEVISGVCYNVGFCFVLDRKMSIGTDMNCDLVFVDETMAPVNTQIGIINGNVMISDAEKGAPSYIGGMKIFGPNVLRSGDIVTIGNTSFKVTF